MAILVDISQIIISNVAMAQFLGRRDGTVIDESFMKHMIINSLRLYNQKFKREYGQMIICVDSKNTWRKAVFPHYKAKRHEAKEQSSTDWNVVYSSLNGMIKDLKEYFPYVVVKVEGCEADDIIGTLVKNLSIIEKVIVVSEDKDFIQLLTYDNVSIFKPISKTLVQRKD